MQGNGSRAQSCQHSSGLPIPISSNHSTDFNIINKISIGDLKVSVRGDSKIPSLLCIGMSVVIVHGEARDYSTERYCGIWWDDMPSVP